MNPSVSRGSDSPSLLTARTLNLYLWLGVRPFTVNSVGSGPVSPQGTQFPVS